MAPADAYVVNGEQDSDGNPADVLELDIYENTCYRSVSQVNNVDLKLKTGSIPNKAQPDLQKRWDNLLVKLVDSSLGKRSIDSFRFHSNESLPSVCLDEISCFAIPYLDPEAQKILAEVQSLPHTGLEPRARTPKICLPNNQSNRLRARNYPSVSVLSATKDFYRVAKSGVKAGVCASLPLILGNRVPGIDYVVEHVTELQTPAQYANMMLQGKLPAGDDAASAGYDWSSIFKAGGFFQQASSLCNISTA